MRYLLALAGWLMSIAMFAGPASAQGGCGGFLQPPCPPDTTPPDTVIQVGPSGPHWTRDATFVVAPSEPATFECALDGAAFSPCTSPKKYPGLTGSHSFQVRARDTAGNLDPTPAQRTWTAPTVSLRLGFRDNVWNDLRNHWGFPDPESNYTNIPHYLSLAKFTASSAKLWAVNLNWGREEAAQGEPLGDGYFQTQGLDELYNAAQANGFQIVWVVMGTPYWALTPANQGATGPAGQCNGQPNSTCFAPPNVDPSSPGSTVIADAWKAWITRILNRYPNSAAVQVWNEPNLREFWWQAQDPELYARMLRLAKDAAIAANTSIPILTGGFSDTHGDAQNSSLETMLHAVYQPPAGASAFDGIGFHAYPCKTDGWVPSIQADVARVEEIRDITYQDGEKPLWMTEVGITTGNGGTIYECTAGETVSEAEQAAALGDIIDYYKGRHASQGDVYAVIVHQLLNQKWRDLMGAPIDSYNEHGLVAWTRNAFNGDVTAAEKAAYWRFRCESAGEC